MSVIFNDNIFHLATPEVSYVFMLGEMGNLVHLYYGKKINDIDNIKSTIADFATAAQPREVTDDGGYLQTGDMPLEYPVFGNPDLRKPAFHANYKNGSRITKFTYLSHEIIKGKPEIQGLPSTYVEDDSEADTLILKMHDEKTGLVIEHIYTVYNCFNAITRRVRAVNGGSDNINISAIMSMSIDFENNDYEFMHLHGSWTRERHIDRIPLSHAGVTIGSSRGMSSHQQSPFFALLSKNATEESGEAYGFSFVYSGNFEAGAIVTHTNMTRVYMGINSFDFNWLLEPGETFEAPEVVMVYSDEGIGKMSRTYHKLYRTRLCRGRYRDETRPVLINNWEGTYFDFDEEKIVNIAKKEKELDIDLMVLDDGWFGVRNDDTTSLGDWVCNREKLPNGIEGLAKKVNDIGMKFGLWFEPEMVSPDSDLYRAHPDWCVHVEGRMRNLGRNQLVLDLSRDDVCDYIIAFMSDALSKASISYIKWDMNRGMSDFGSAKLPPERQCEFAHRYMLGLYRVLKTLTEKFPDVLFEGCASGGGRFDAGMLPYFVQYWTSDDSEAVERMKIQDGTSIVMPSSAMGAHVSAVPNHQNGRSAPLSTRGYTAMCGQFGYELDITKMPEEELEEIKEQVALYKSIRNVIQKGDMYRLRSLFSGNEVVWEYVYEDTVIVYIGVALYGIHMPPKKIKLAGLDKNARYKIRGTDIVYSGELLMNCGTLLDKDIDKDFGSAMIIFDKID